MVITTRYAIGGITVAAAHQGFYVYDIGITEQAVLRDVLSLSLPRTVPCWQVDVIAHAEHNGMYTVGMVLSEEQAVLRTVFQKDEYVRTILWFLRVYTAPKVEFHKTTKASVVTHTLSTIVPPSAVDGYLQTIRHLWEVYSTAVIPVVVNGWVVYRDGTTVHMASDVMHVSITQGGNL